MNRARRLIWIAPLALIAITLFAILGGEAVKWLWNWLTPPLFGWRTITFWQALAMLALARILFGGPGFGGSGGSLRRRMQERWDVLTPEEREKIRQRMRARWGFGAPPGEGTPTA
ncbi:MAG TPA: hypothetical protein VMJ70_10460 [Candidatus Sulfotelmatobacter sp.]|nr:hypothetical protein [Candidatus Sulfotelmatobacter sp.]